MGAWGYGITQSDDAFDIVDVLELLDETDVMPIVMAEKSYLDNGVSPAMVAAHWLMSKGRFLPEAVVEEANIEYEQLRGTAEEFGWDNPAAREKAHTDFINFVNAYVRACIHGEDLEFVSEPVLFDTIAEELS